MTGGVTQTVEGLSSNPRPTIKKKVRTKKWERMKEKTEDHSKRE
jgi:hypothetical protein